MTATTFKELLGKRPVVGCEHPRPDINLFTRPEREEDPHAHLIDPATRALANEWRDWRYALRLAEKMEVNDLATITTVVVCIDCHMNAPTEKEARYQQAAKTAQQKREKQQRNETRLEDLIASGAELVQCPACDEVFDAEEMTPIRQCPIDSCQADSFDGSEGRNCTECNRPFTRLLTERGHADCADSWNEDDECIDWGATDG